MQIRSYRPSAYAVYLTLEGAVALFLGISGAVNLVYQVQVAHLNALQLVLVGTALEGGALLFQTPTGLFADLYSRRRSILLGVLFLGAGCVLRGILPLFWLIALASVVSAVGYCFLDGATEAWIAGELGDALVGRAFMRGAQMAQIGALVGVLIGTGLGMLRLNLPIIAGGVLLLLLAGLLTLALREHHFTPATPADLPSWRAGGRALRRSVSFARRSPILLMLLAVAAVEGMSSEGFDRLNVAHFLRDVTVPMLGPLKPVAWFGLMSAVGSLLGLLAVEIVRRRLNADRAATLARWLFALTLLWGCGVVAFGLAGSFAFALAMFWLVGVARTTINPIERTWVTQQSAPELRATLISMSGQMDAIGQVAGGPVVGVIGTLRSLRAALVTTGAFLFPAALLYSRALRTGEIGAPSTVLEETAAPVDAV